MLRRFPSGYFLRQTVSVRPWCLRFGRHGKGRTVRLLDFPKATQLAAKPGLKIPSPECSDSYVNCPGMVPLQDPGTGGLVTERYCGNFCVRALSIPGAAQLGLNLQTAHPNKRKIF